jgi:hypothetical protein
MSTASPPTTIAPGSGASAAILVNLTGQNSFAKLNGRKRHYKTAFRVLCFGAHSSVPTIKRGEQT